MKKYLYLAIAAICLGLSACGSDDEELQPANTGEVNTTDLAVTGSVQEFSLEEKGNDDVRISAEIVGYLNLNDTLRLAIGLSPVYGIEMSEKSSFPENETKQFSAKRMDDNRKFTITATGLKENTTYYYRTYLTNTIFGKTESFITESYESVAAKMTIPTGSANNIKENSATINMDNDNTGVAYATEKALLTASNVKKAVKGNAVNGLSLSKYGSLTELASGTTYYYCEYRKLSTYIITGEIKSFDTSGFNAKELAKQMTINASLNTNTQMWNVSIQSPLSMPGKTIKYGVTHKMTTAYDFPGADSLMVSLMYRYTGNNWEDDDNVYKLYSSYGRGRTLYGAVVFNKSIYATKSGNSYKASIDNPYYNGFKGYNSVNEEWQDYENWWDSCIDDFVSWMGLDLLMELKEKIKNGVADEIDEEIYSNLLDHYSYVVNNLEYASYAKCYLQVFVEIDGVRYIVKEQEGKLRVPTPEDNPIDCNYDSNNRNNDDDDDEDRFSPDAQA